jgi:hypothetical protein
MAVAGEVPDALVCARHSRRFDMKRATRLIGLGIALAVNVAAFAALNFAMVDGAERDRLSQQESERILISAPRQELPDREILATQNCPGRKAL